MVNFMLTWLSDGTQFWSNTSLDVAMKVFFRCDYHLNQATEYSRVLLMWWAISNQLKP